VARQALDVALPYWHTSEPVSEVVYGTRAFDTFGETFLLLAAIVGITVIARGRERRRGFLGEGVAGRREQRQTARPSRGGERDPAARRAEEREEGLVPGPRTPDETPLGAPAPETAEGMTVIIRGAVRAVAPLLAMAGLYLGAWSYSPGGGFPAGAVLLGVVLFAYAALGYRRIERVVRPDVLEPVELAGALAVAAIGALGLFLKGSFFANFLPLAPAGTIRSGGILQAFSVTELVEVSTGLTIAVFALLGMGHDWSGGRDGDGEGRS
jgi:multicomponent Na+:H+ antiporter subunit B